MTKRTSTSASAAPETSSPSGTPARTGNAANKRPKRSKRLGRFGGVIAHIDAQSSQEFRQSLTAAGILGKDGKLAEKYTAKKK